MVDALNRYTGQESRQPLAGARDENKQPIYPYLPDDDLVEAVNLAIYLKRPLLLKGEPGSGKTRLARAVAHELGLQYEAWHIRSTSRAQDGFYTFDNVARLRDAQLVGTKHLRMDEYTRIIARLHDTTRYVKWGKLGRVFQREQPTVVLIDEIDKADIDFPNDLLQALDERHFTVEETGQEIWAREGAEPIIFITSNDEKDLPDAFLRRCLFHHIEFPPPDRLEKIVKLHFRSASEELVNKAVERFQHIRDRMKREKGDNGKKVGTSELLDWFQILSLYQEDEALKQIEGRLPASVLFKSLDDHLKYMGFQQ